MPSVAVIYFAIFGLLAATATASLTAPSLHSSLSPAPRWESCAAYTQRPRGKPISQKSESEVHVDELVASHFTQPHLLGIHAFSKDVPKDDDAEPIEKLEAKCATVRVPLFYDKPEAGTIDIFVKQLPGSSAGPRKSLWLLQGGPGGSSDSLEPAMHVFHSQLGPDWDIYTTDHRGVGRSQRMNCLRSQAETQGSPGGVNIEEQEFSGCNDEVRDVGTSSWSFAFTIDNAARDLSRLIDVTRNGSNSDAFVYAISYGTMWAQRYLLLHPTQPRGVVLDGVVTTSGAPGEITTFDNWAKGQNEIGFRYLTYCSKDQECASRFGGDPIAFTMKLYQRLWGPEEHCRNGTAIMSLNMLRGLIGILLMSPETRPLMPALLYRLDRCAPEDIQFLSNVVKRFTPAQPGPDQPPLSSPQLQANIAGSELLDLSRPLDDIKKAEAEVFWGSPGGSMYHRWIVSHDYPIYPRDPNTFGQTLNAPTVPVLLLNGDLDPQTPDPYARKTAYDLQNRTARAQLVIVPGAVHYTLMRSAVNGSSLHCGMQMTLDFVRNPDRETDTGCLQRLTPLDFKGDQVFNKALLFSITQGDLYDGTFPTDTPAKVATLDGVSWRTFTLVVVLLSIAVVAVAVFTGLMVHHVHMHKRRRHAATLAASSAAPAARGCPSPANAKPRPLADQKPNDALEQGSPPLHAALEISPPLSKRSDVALAMAALAKASDDAAMQLDHEQQRKDDQVRLTRSEAGTSSQPPSCQGSPLHAAEPVLLVSSSASDGTASATHSDALHSVSVVHA